jgi:hypothetical protein
LGRARALILAATIYLTVARYLRHKERIAQANSGEVAVLSARLDVLEEERERS